METTDNTKKLIVGLGNPDKKYKITRHNCGFIIVDAIVEELGLQWKPQKKLKGLLAMGDEISCGVIYLKPLTYMNNSGEAVALTTNYYNVFTKNLIVIHDDADLDLFDIKIQFGKSSAGHNGIESIIEKIGTKDFWRIRVGVGRPKDNKYDIEYHVLSKFTNEEYKKIKELSINVKKDLQSL